ncbi:DUF2589 domain-containing protein [[Clostridium] spiroforme]|nr:DUF2589 domain-containing protein [Thomasclavelia spiroformis]MBM6881342.1 DUF2589 domain-containing protein [Thomasclavelia spiroformis]
MSDRFKGIDMENLIGAPLKAVAEASDEQLSQKITECVVKNHQQKTEINQPDISVVPVPDLSIKQGDIQFNMEMNETKEENS